MSDEIISYLEGLGVDAEGAKLYKALAVRGPQTLLQISRLTGMERTKLYRSIGDWVDLGIIEEELAFKTKRFRAAPIERMKLFVTQKKASMDGLAGAFSSFSDQVSSLMQAATTTKVLYYHGREGARQMLWNSMRAKDELLSYVYRNWQETVGQTFFNNWVGEFRKMAIPNRELRHPHFLSTVDESKLVYQDLGPTYSWRTIAPSIMNITHGMDIYDDVVAMSYWDQDDFFGVEMYNEYIAKMQKSIFEHFWKLTKK